MTLSADRERFEAHAHPLVEAQLSQVPTTLREAVAYALSVGGKRIRPILVYRAARALGHGDAPALEHAAAAIELVHTYSLIHDDLPAMDDDDLRRGQPTLHRAYDEATAILVGDGMQVQAFSLLTAAPGLTAARRLAMVDVLAAASGFPGMVGGQYIDVAATGEALGLDALKAMHNLKTGALIRAALALGGHSADADETALLALDRYGEHIGLAFQVVDDILDVESDSATLGKTQGKDAAANKSTYVSLLGIDGARREVTTLLDAAIATLSPLGDNADDLRELARYIVARDR
ncbi:polyprenyl synthetase family protein [Pseudohaliea rubra]|uniref:Octaprenyl-diphosphate synthase n=1 Tax=Pseudohaliea rubra DSM 19751 TaxID=1265313 RepID=A0A095WW00_9GAMM|nr:farnesyl diphosphate synthase [Pseudohaliea rubra]KGE02829.1 Octaprenyl-diphosphate synthase [Pseudohaliea rubra DSM 19751]